MRVSITGASGFLGSALAKAYSAQGASVVALVRRTSRIDELRQIGAEIICGDLDDVEAIDRLLHGSDLGIHCAALTREYGTWQEFLKINVGATKNFLEAGLKHNCPRLVYVSSVAVYGNGRHHRGTDEDAGYESVPLDNYTRSKIMADRLAFEYHQKFKLPVTVVRPGYIWGIGDRVVLPRLVKAIKRNRLYLVDGGNNLMNLSHIDNVVQGIMLAASAEVAIGQAYNLTDGSKVTTRRFVEDIIGMLGINYPLRSVPYVPAYMFAYICELWAGLHRYRIEPPVTRYAVRMGKYDQAFDISKAIYQIGYRPRVQYKEGMAALADFLRSLYQTDQ